MHNKNLTTTSMSDIFRDKIGKELLFFDGAMGTLLQAEGIPAGYFPERWNVEKPNIIRDIHKAYLEAGCHVLTTNTFGAGSIKFGKTPVDLIKAGISLAKEAVHEAGRGLDGSRDAFVAFDMSPTGHLLQPMGPLSFEEAYTAFSDMVKAATENYQDKNPGDTPDLILIETMIDTYELKAAVLAAKDNCDLPIVASAMLDQQGKLLTGGDVTAVVALLEGLGVDVIGLNCGFGPAQMLPFVKSLMETTSLPVMVNPNAGLPISEDGMTVFSADPDQFEREMQDIAKCGPWLLGGCCGTTPDHMARLVASRKGKNPSAVREKNTTLASSYSHAVDICAVHTVIGEKINPTGNKALSGAFKEGNMEAVVQCALAQKQAGAGVLDVNVGLPGLDEVSFLPLVLREIQQGVDTPLMIDTSNVKAMEAAVRLYNGKPVLNSVNGSASSLASVLPIAAKYGGVIVGLAMDEEGIPKTVEGRVAIARRIIETAREYGIPSKDILIDTLTMTVSAEPGAAIITLETLKSVKEQLGVGTVLGVSNVSFGLPQREEVTRTFYTLAIEAGLDAAIINPLSSTMMSAYHTLCLLHGKDESVADYIKFATTTAQASFQTWKPASDWAQIIAGAEDSSGAGSRPAGTCSNTPGARIPTFTPVAEPGSLYDAIIDGLKEGAARTATAMLKTTAPMEIINDHIIPALTRIGETFESGETFLPQLLNSAEAAGKAFDVLKGSMEEQTEADKGKVLLATVKGDIHDIGKNIVKVLLENYGYNVFDLGRDVAPKDIVETALSEDISLIGLSALMTTTVPAMAETIRQLKSAGHLCKIVVGGAVLTEEYAASIDADFYAKDAMATVRYAEDLFES